MEYSLYVLMYCYLTVDYQSVVFSQLKKRVFLCNMDPPEKHQDYVDQLRRKVVVHDLWSPRGEAPVSKLSRQTSHLG